MANLENVPPHELRTRWFRAISSSFPGIITWRVARDQQASMLRHYSYLRHELPRVTRLAALDDYWTFSELAAWIDKWYYMYAFTVTQYKFIMDSLERRKLNWRAQSPTYRENVIKRMVVLHHYAFLLRRSFADVWKQIDRIIKRPKDFQALRTEPVTHMKRRWSAGDIGFSSPQTIRNRWLLERTIRSRLRSLETKMVSSFLLLREQYNSGQSFRYYYQWTVWSNEARWKHYSERGGKYKYPRSMWSLSADSDDEFWRPVNGVIERYEDDEVLSKAFH